MEYRAPHPMMNVGSPPFYPPAGSSANKLAKRTECAPNKGGPFAAALRTLAKNAGPDAKDGSAVVDREKEKAPAPKRASPHHLPTSGFQPYRPDDRLSHPAAAAAASFPLLEPTAYSPYPHPSLYSSAALQYRLAAEEQMYLERVFRSGVGVGVPGGMGVGVGLVAGVGGGGVGWLPPYALYPSLHPLLHAPHPHPHDEREKEIALHREREREREREQREKEQRERERAQREKENRVREALRDERARALGALLPPPLLYRPYRPFHDHVITEPPKPQINDVPIALTPHTTQVPQVREEEREVKEERDRGKEEELKSDPPPSSSV